MEEERKRAEAVARVEEEKKKKLEETWESKKDQWEQDKKDIKNKAIQDQGIGRDSKGGDLGIVRVQDSKGGDAGPLAHVGEGKDPGQQEAAVGTPSPARSIYLSITDLGNEQGDGLTPPDEHP